MTTTRSKIADIRQQLQKPLAVGESWYIVDSRWYEQWKKFVNLDGSEETVLDESNNPGPVDNSPILIGGKLKQGLIENVDFVAVPEAVWKYFTSTFGKSPNQEPTCRKVINASAEKEFPQIEVYPLEITLSQKGDPKRKKVAKTFSKTTTLQDVITEFRNAFIVPSSSPLRVLEVEKGGKFREIKEEWSQTLDQLGIPSNTEICVQLANKDGGFTSLDGKLSPVPTASLTLIPTTNVDKKTGLTSSHMATSRSSMADHDASGSKMQQPGICGLNNLGNTCFMNSILQCLSNVPPLTRHFLEGRYKDEINEDNPLGNGGEIARAYAELVRALWSGQHSAFAPRQFKLQVGRFAPQFSGYQQHDSQELLTFLLDGLHEDLNRIQKKPYSEQKDSDDRPDEEVAAEAWENYRKRNDSIIVDLFHGLLKSTVICPECNKVSVTFDPFCTLSLPLPVKKERVIEVFLVKEDPSARPIRYRCTVPKAGTMKDLCEIVSKHSGVLWDELVVTDMYNHRFMRVYQPEDTLTTITERDITYVDTEEHAQYNYKEDIAEIASRSRYQIPCKLNDPSHHLLYVYNREKKKTTYGSPVTFGLPYVIAVSKNQLSYDKLYEIIMAKMSRYAKTLESGDERWSEILPEKTEKDNAGSASDADTQTDPMETDVSTAVNDVEEDPGTPKQPFRLNIVNANASAVITPLAPNNGKPLKLASRSYISCDWPTVLREACYNSNEAGATEDDPVTNSSKVTAKRSSIYLKDCLELYTTVERLGADDAWYCPRCKKHQQATKKFDIWSLPDILVIQLKRFSYNRWSRDKLDVHVDFPTQELEMNHYVIQKDYRKSVYDLVCISNHYGGLGCGHYTAYCKNADDGRWYLFDDSSVSSVSSVEQVVTKSAYVLFYIRRDPDSSHFHRPAVTEIPASVMDHVDDENSMDQS